MYASRGFFKILRTLKVKGFSSVAVFLINTILIGLKNFSTEGCLRSPRIWRRHTHTHTHKYSVHANVLFVFYYAGSDKISFLF